MELTDIKVIRSLLERHGFSFSKSLGQNFLINPAIPVKIAEASCVTKDDTVLEIGPGIGCLTKELAKRAGKVIAVEIDSRLIPILNETLAEYDNVQVINNDILKTDISEFGHLKVCANLPYYITTPIMMYLLENYSDIIDSITVMVQKELAQRLVSLPGSSEYGSVTAAVSYYAKGHIAFGVSSGSFMPAPKVDSSVVYFDVCGPNISVSDEKMFFRVIRASFSMRRKTLMNCFSSSFALTKSELNQIFETAGISSSARGETLGLTEFASLSEAIGKFAASSNRAV